MTKPTRIVYCHCAYAKVIPPETKKRVLSALGSSGVAFTAVSDLCEMSARKDPALGELTDAGPLRIAACYPRAVKWLFHAAGTPLADDDVEIHNMRAQDADELVPLLLRGQEAVGGSAS